MLVKFFRYFVTIFCLTLLCELFFDRMWLISFTWPAAYFIVKKWSETQLAAKRRMVRDQFKMFLYSLSTSLSAGKSLENSLQDVQLDLSRYYPADSDLFIIELLKLNIKLQNGLTVEHAMVQFAEQFDSLEIQKFCHLIRSVKRQSGDLLSVIRTASQVIAEKIEVEQEIQVITAQKKFESRVMMLIPVIFLALMKSTSAEYMYVLYYSTSGIIIMLIALFVFLFSAHNLNKNMSIEL